MNKSKKLLTFGMGLSALALMLTALNVAVLPFARALYGYGAALSLAAMAMALFAMLYAGRRMQRMGEHALLRAASITRPCFLILLLLAHLIMGYLMEYTPMGDNHMLFDGPRTLAQLGNFGGQDYDLYLARFSNQWGFFLMITAFCRGLLALGIENQFYAMVVVQALLYTAAIHCLLSIARRLGGVRAELLLTGLLAAFMPLYLAAAVLYTDTFSLPFVIFTLHFALKTADAKTLPGTLLQAAACGLCAFIGCQIKMTVAIVLIAACIVWLLSKKIGHRLCAALLSGAILVLGTQGLHGVMLRDVLDPAMVAQHNTPTIHWVMMSIPTGDNPYGNQSRDYNITWTMMEEGASREAVMDSIYSRMKDKIYTLRYPNRLLLAMLRKNASSQGDGTFGMTEMLDDGPVRENAVSQLVLEGRPHYAVYSAVCSGVWYAALMLAALAVYADIRRRDLRLAIPAVSLLGMLLFLLLWEARSRYMFSFTPVLLLLAACCASGDDQWFLRRKTYAQNPADCG